MKKIEQERIPPHGGSTNLRITPTVDKKGPSTSGEIPIGEKRHGDEKMVGKGSHTLLEKGWTRQIKLGVSQDEKLMEKEHGTRPQECCTAAQKKGAELSSMTWGEKEDRIPSMSRLVRREFEI